MCVLFTWFVYILISVCGAVPYKQGSIRVDMVFDTQPHTHMALRLLFFKEAFVCMYDQLAMLILQISERRQQPSIPHHPWLSYKATVDKHVPWDVLWYRESVFVSNPFNVYSGSIAYIS